MLFTTTEEIKRYVQLNTNYSFENLRTAVSTATHEYIVPLLGETLYMQLHKKYSDNKATALWGNLLDKTQAALAFYTLFEALPEANVHVSEMGIMQTVADDYDVTRPATNQAVNNLERSYQKNGYRRAEYLLQFLQKHIDFFTSWEHSEAFTQTQETFVGSYSELKNQVPQISSGKVFLQIRPHLALCERKYLLPTLCQRLYDDIKGKYKAGDKLNSFEQNIVRLSKQAICWLAVYEGISLFPVRIEAEGLYVRETHNDGRNTRAADERTTEAFRRHVYDTGKSFLQELRTFLEDKADYIPLYKESECYTKKCQNERFYLGFDSNNDENDSSFFV